jgi:hypothetical protein
MSDMSGSAAPPHASDHERHDALLVAQSTAGDPLPTAQRAEAQRLVSTCPDCATLAADLRAVSVAVAREPVPPRRRDYRLSREQADGLSGNALARWLRRLSPPTSRAFQPLAAGVLSVGLLFVVAGYAWPDGGAITVQAEPNFASYGDATLAPVPAEATTAALLEEAASAFTDPRFSESLDEHQAGTSERALQKSMPSEPEDRQLEAPELEAPELEAMKLEAPPAAAPEGPADVAGTDSDVPDQATVGGATAESDLMAGQAADDAALDGLTSVVEPGSAAGSETTPTGDAPDLPLDQSGPEDLLIVLGLLLALGGGGLFLLGWLARRASDPLLR